MRQYQKAWHILRTKGEVQLVAHPKHHHRIRKAISKERYMDLGFRMELQELEKRATIVTTYGTPENPKLLILKLSYTLGVDDV